MSEHGYCGQMGDIPKGKYGCGEDFIWAGEIFRCVDCGMAFHKRCLKKHCDSDLDSVRAQLVQAQARTHEQDARIEKLEKALEDIKENANGYQCSSCVNAYGAALAALEAEKGSK